MTDRITADLWREAMDTLSEARIEILNGDTRDNPVYQRICKLERRVLEASIVGEKREVEVGK